MRMLVGGIFNNKAITHNKIRKATTFYGNLLFKENTDLLNEICVHIKGVGGFNESTGCNAITSFTDNVLSPRRFVISMDSDLKEKQGLLCLAHEMVHVMQYATGTLQQSLDGTGTRWYGQLLDHNSLHYYDYPWEIDAYGREFGLYYRYIDDHDGKDDETSFEDILNRL